VNFHEAANAKLSEQGFSTLAMHRKSCGKQSGLVRGIRKVVRLFRRYCFVVPQATTSTFLPEQDGRLAPWLGDKGSIETEKHILNSPS
jgi:hypothetical protein